MNRIWHFLKWNFTGMQPFTKRYISYFVSGLVFSLFWPGGFMVSIVLMGIDLTVDMIRSRYNAYLEDMQKTVDTLKGDDI